MAIAKSLYRPYVARLSRFVFDLAVTLHILQPWGPSNDMENAAGHVNTRAEAERRRALALQALDQRLASKPATSNTANSQSNRGSSSQPGAASSVGLAQSSSSSGQTAVQKGSDKKPEGEVMFDAQDEGSAAADKK